MHNPFHPQGFPFVFSDSSPAACVFLISLSLSNTHTHTHSPPPPPHWGTADAEMKDQSVENPKLKDWFKQNCYKVLPLKPGAGPYLAMHATPTARDFFLSKFYPSVHSSLFFPKPPQILPVLAVANNGSCMGLQSKRGHPAYRYRHVMQVPVLSARGI